jgi:hypothetical protein
MPGVYQLHSIKGDRLSALENADLLETVLDDRPRGRQAKTPGAAAKRYAQFALQHVRAEGRRAPPRQLTTTIVLAEGDQTPRAYRVRTKYLNTPVVFERGGNRVEVRYQSELLN